MVDLTLSNSMKRAISNSIFLFVAPSSLHAETEAKKTAGYNELRNPYFGQTHQHTGWWFDAATYNVPSPGPENSYRHAHGEKVKHPNGNLCTAKAAFGFSLRY